MTSRLARLMLATGALLMLALPAVASAHGGRDHDRGDRGRGRDASRVCRAAQDARVPRRLTAEQAQALATACTTRATAVQAADDAFDAAVKPALDTYRAAVTPLLAQVRTAAQARRDACRADRRAQACTDARTAYRTTVAGVQPQLRAAREAYRAAIRPAAQTFRTAVRAAQDAFRASVSQALGRS
jgi:hypothetical protein